jgi:hypothetical protein
MVITTTSWCFSAVLACLSLGPLGQFFDYSALPVFHTWGLGHGSFIIALPILLVAWQFVLLFFLKQLFRDER